NRGNERQVEEFIARLSAEVGNRAYEVSRRAGREPVGPEDARRWEAACRRSDAPCVVIERQRLSALAVRTTRWNYLFTVPGESEDRVVLVAHYDTWRGPGADDNRTGEEILKQYLLADLRREPYHRHAGRGSRDRARDPALPYDAAHSHLDRQRVQAREQGRQSRKSKAGQGLGNRTGND